MADILSDTDSLRQSGTRNFWRYWTGSTISNAGDSATAVAMPLVAVLILHSTAFEVGLVSGAGDLAWLMIGLPAGVIVARLPLRGVQAAMDLVRAAAIASIPVAAGLHVLSLAQLFVVALVVGLAGVVFMVGNSTFLPSIVSKEELARRNSLMASADAATMLGGPALGGVLVQTIGAAMTLIVDSVSYVASAVLLYRLPRPETAQSSSPHGSVWSSVVDGLKYVAGHRVIASCAAMVTAVNFVAGALTPLTPLFLVRTLGSPATVVGAVLATDGIGALLGAAFTPKLADRIGSGRAVLGATVVCALSVVLMPLASPKWGVLLFAVGNTGFALGVAILSVLTRTHRQTVTPRDLLSRVMATVRFFSWGAIPIGAVAAGTVASLAGVRTALWGTCLFAALPALVLWSSPVRRHRDLS